MDAYVDTTIDPPLHRFLNRARTHPPLDGDQELAVVERVQAGDREAVDELVDANLRLVADAILVGTSLRRGLDLRELCDEGTVALVVAVRQYDADRHGPFRRYALRRIQRAMIDPEG